MTRINLIAVQDLADQHLFAEWREIKMIPARLRKAKISTSCEAYIKDIPSKYTMNTGHVRFFYNKLSWLYLRYLELTDELLYRKFSLSRTNAYDIFLRDMPPEFIGTSWQPSNNEVLINLERIILRISEKPLWYRFHGDAKSCEFFNNMYSKYKNVES